MRIHFTKTARALSGVILAARAVSRQVMWRGKTGSASRKRSFILSRSSGIQESPTPQKQDVINGIKEMAAKIPGIRNVWLKADRLEPRDFSWAYAIEFRDRDAADAYAESTLHEAWEKRYVPLRYTSISVQVTNP